MTVDECFQKHSLCSWAGMLWFHQSRKFFDLLEEYRSSWDDFGSSVSILVIASYIWDVGEAYLIFFVSTWDTPALWGQCLRIFCDLWVFDLEVYFVTFVAVTMPTCLIQPPDTWSGELHYDLDACDLLLTFGYDSERTTLALWLFMTGYWLRSRAEHSTLLDGLELWEDISVRRTVLEMEHEVPMLFCIARGFCIGIWVEHFVLN